VELVDLHPTLAELAGLPVHPQLEGKSLKPLLANPQAAWDKPAFTQVTRNAETSITVAVDPSKPAFMGRSVRTERWCYIEWAEGREGVELYDMQTDPGQLRNVAADPRNGPVIAATKKLLEHQAGRK
jgi:iduronate 2-sulfatase